MTRLLAVNGSYRENGAIDQAVKVAMETVSEAGAAIEIIYLRDFPIEFCHNCRQCTQVPGEAPGSCVLQDRMHELIEKIEAADGYILASPTNFYSVTAVFKRFMERLVVYAYWPWGSHAPKLRKKKKHKKGHTDRLQRCARSYGTLFLRDLKATEDDGGDHWRQTSRLSIHWACVPTGALHIA